jgi:hypothetical protein
MGRARGALHIVVLGIMGRTPLAGVVWQAMHYLEGFRRLGHEVVYVEDTGAWPYDPGQNTLTEDVRYAVQTIEAAMTLLGLPDRWAYRAAPPGSRLFGLGEAELAQVCRDADVLVNVTGAACLREEYLRVPVRIYLETDPVLSQIEAAQGRESMVAMLAAHTHHFTFGENIGTAECALPVDHVKFQHTRQPVVLDWWATDGEVGPQGRFTTISSWRQTEKDVEWNGVNYRWSKHRQFLEFIDLPRRAPTPVELALACHEPEAVTLLRSHGWQVLDGLALSRDLHRYRDYIQSAAGEFTVAKEQYVQWRTGWFSDRSACYLAAGRPVITQDTGFDQILPTGLGLFAFTTMDDVLGAMDALARDYPGHARAARTIAGEYFQAERVLDDLLVGAGVV